MADPGYRSANMLPMNLQMALLMAVSLLGCSIAQAQSDAFGKNLYPGPGVIIQKSTDGLERTIKIEQDWLGDKYGPLRFVCEASSVDRLLEYLAERAGTPISEIKGKNLLPKGTYRYSFPHKTWADRAEILKDVMMATGEAFGLILEMSQDGPRTITIKPKQSKPAAGNAGHGVSIDNRRSLGCVPGRAVRYQFPK